MMGERWTAALGKTMEEMQAEGDMGNAMGFMLVSALVSSWAVNWVYGLGAAAMGESSALLGLMAGLLVWVGFSGARVDQHGFEHRPWSLYGIDKGWLLITYLLCGLVAGLFVTV